MSEKRFEKLLEDCDCQDIDELCDYIDYLKNVKADYELLKGHVRHIYSEMQSFY